MPERNPRALSVEDLVRALKMAGSRTISEESIAKDITDGAPLNADGSVDIYKYAAWVLMKENGHGS